MQSHFNYQFQILGPTKQPSIRYYKMNFQTLHQVSLGKCKCMAKSIASLNLGTIRKILGQVRQPLLTLHGQMSYQIQIRDRTEYFLKFEVNPSGHLEEFEIKIQNNFQFSQLALATLTDCSWPNHFCSCKSTEYRKYFLKV